jgi:hypothetical protein
MATISGNVQQWQRVTIDFLGPQLAEGPETFTDYRLDVEFRNNATGQTLKVPGFFAADGNDADTGATSGNVWRIHFTPPDDGTWTYTASFRQGTGIAASLDPNAGTATSFNGESGSIEVAMAATTGSEFRTDGMLVQDGHYLEHAGNGELWIKGGSDSPENFLGYADFDNTYDQSGGAIKTWSAHLADYNVGDPTWDGGKGTEIIGAVNYLAEHGVNAQYMLLMNVNADDRDVWPWTSETARTTYDVSKLAQWEIVFEHMDNVGVSQHFVMQETENDQLLGGMSVERLVYYREMIARFGHHLGVVWNMGEENTNTTAERQAFMQFFEDLDPYHHPVVLHNLKNLVAATFDPLLGYQPMDGISLRSDDPRATIIQYRSASAANSDPWLITFDEVGPWQTGVLPDSSPDADANHDIVRAMMWGALTAGAAGIEWFAGSGPEGDHDGQNFAVRESVWAWTTIGRQFFESLPLQDMVLADSLTPSSSDYVLAKPGSVYAIYLPTGGSASLDLSGASGTFNVTWFNPRTGESTVGGTVTGGSVVNLGSPPNTPNEDWAVRVEGGGGEPPPSTSALGRYYLFDAATDQVIPS